MPEVENRRGANVARDPGGGGGDVIGLDRIRHRGFTVSRDKLSTVNVWQVTTSTDFELGPFPDAPGYETAAKLDEEDSLAKYRERFVVHDPTLIYLDGNSLGRQPREAREIVDQVMSPEWSERLIGSWNDRWWDLQLDLGDLLAPLLGARPGEVVVSDSTSVNLYKLAGAAVRARPDRTRIITDDLNFPTDVYVLDGLARSHGLELTVVPSDQTFGPVEEILEEIDDRTALVSLSHTAYMSGYTYDMGLINAAAHDAGALTLWDLSHSAGAVPVDLEGTRTDLATGCTYKYLNGGPGSPAFLYVRESHQRSLENPIAAWWGHTSPFDMSLEFEPTDGIRRFHTGTMPILSLAAVEPGIRLALDAGIEAIRRKSVLLTSYFIEQWERHLARLGFELASPADPDRRGSHVSLRHDDGWRVTRALIEIAGVVPDFRSPDTVRFGFAPLYTSFSEIHTAVQRLERLVEQGMHETIDASRTKVT